MALKPLTPKERKFAFAYVGDAAGNGAGSARLAGYKGSDNVLRVTAHRLLMKPNILALIDELRATDEGASEMKRAECLQGYAAIARSDIADVFEADGTFDLQKAKARGVSRFIKALNFDKETGRVTKVELYSALEARRDIGKHLGLFPTRIVLSPDDADDVIDKAIEKYGLPDTETPASDLTM